MVINMLRILHICMTPIHTLIAAPLLPMNRFVPENFKAEYPILTIPFTPEFLTKVLHEHIH